MTTLAWLVVRRWAARRTVLLRRVVVWQSRSVRWCEPIMISDRGRVVSVLISVVLLTMFLRLTCACCSCVPSFVGLGVSLCLVSGRLKTARIGFLPITRALASCLLSVGRAVAYSIMA